MYFQYRSCNFVSYPNDQLCLIPLGHTIDSQAIIFHKTSSVSIIDPEARIIQVHLNVTPKFNFILEDRIACPMRHPTSQRTNMILKLCTLTPTISSAPELDEKFSSTTDLDTQLAQATPSGGRRKTSIY